MRVALIARSTLKTVQGGDTIQVLKTADELKKLGVTADVFLASDTIPYEQYDLLHFFNIIRPADHLYHIHKSRKPYVVSTIYLDYSVFDRFGRGNIHRILFNILGKPGSEYLKNMYRFMRRQDSMISKQYVWGHMRAMKNVLKGAALILPNSQSEFQRLAKDTGFSGAYHIVPNGIDAKNFSVIPDDIFREDKVLCVAQIYGMKNQLSLIQACKNLKIPLDIIGTAPPNHQKYYRLCEELSDKNVRFIDFMHQTELIKYYAASRVHALPSWFETTGLSSLEAAALGCNLVVGTGGDTRDYFKDMAWYCQADDLASIESALSNAMDQKNDGTLRDFILTHYTWARAAEETLSAYNKALDEN